MQPCVAQADSGLRGSIVPQPGTWFTQNGPITIHFGDKAKVRIDGAPAPTVAAEADDDFTFSNSIGYHLTPNISAQLILGMTTSTQVDTQGGVLLGKVSYGAPSVVIDYRLNRFGAIQPFVGAGAMYLFFFDEKDATLSNLKADDSVGLILRAGAEVMFSPRIGAYFAANKIFIDADVRANLGAARVDAELELDPWIFQAGMTYRY